MKSAMLSSFETNEWDYLTEHFRLTNDVTTDQEFIIPMIDLLNEGKCMEFMDRLTSTLRSPSRMITASQFSKRYAFLTIVPGLYAMTMYNKALDLSLENCLIKSVNHHESWQSNISLLDLHATQPLTHEKRYKWRDEMIRNLFAGNLTKMWRTMSQVANIPMAILWENTAIRIFSLYEKRIGEGASDQEKLRIRGDFEYLIGGAPGSLFGETENPLAKYYTSKCTPPSSDQAVRIRKTCCYYYKVSSNGDFCTTCPKVKH